MGELNEKIKRKAHVKQSFSLDFLERGTFTEYPDLKLEYRATNRKPTYIVLVCSASKYGDFFTGASGSVLYVDEFSLEYDYDN